MGSTERKRRLRTILSFGDRHKTVATIESHAFYFFLPLRQSSLPESLKGVAMKARKASWNSMNDCSVVRCGLVTLKQVGVFPSLKRSCWTMKWMVLGGKSLSIHGSPGEPPQTVIELRDSMNIERSDAKPHCLLLEAKQKRYYVSFGNDEELYGWYDDIYQRSQSWMVISEPWNFKHDIHISFDPDTGNFLFFPQHWDWIGNLEKPEPSLHANREYRFHDTESTIVDLLDLYTRHQKHGSEVECIQTAKNTQARFGFFRSTLSSIKGLRRASCHLIHSPAGLRVRLPSLSNLSPSRDSGCIPKDLKIVRSGPVAMKRGAGVFSSRWQVNWMILAADTVSLHRYEGPPQRVSIKLRDIVKIERCGLESHCLVLKTKKRQYYLSLRNDNELYGWYDDIYQRSPLAISGSNSYPNFRHHAHACFDPVSGGWLGLPKHWHRLLLRYTSTSSENLIGYDPFRSSLEKTEPVRSGPVPMKKRSAGVFACWQTKWLSLEADTLFIHKFEDSPKRVPIKLRDIVNIERCDSKCHSLLLETKEERYYLSFRNDEELYGWYDDIYQRSPLAISGAPHNFRHLAHAFFDPVAGRIYGLPDNWNKLLTTEEDSEEASEGVYDLNELPIFFNSCCSALRHDEVNEKL